MGWLTDWDEAARRPERTLAFLFVAGLVCGGLIGYSRFGHSLGWAVTLGIVIGLATGSALAFVIALAVGISAGVALGRGGLL